jgi:hypothetical protein
LYGGGGFVADLGYNKSTAENVINNLQGNNWIDEYTAVVFLEFTVFNPASSLFSSAKFLYERFPSGSINTITRIETLAVYSPTNKSVNFFLQICQFLLMVVVLVTAIGELLRIIKQGLRYLKGIWNLVQWVQIISIITAIVMFYLKEKYVNKFIARLKANPYETSSADYIVMWSDLETFVLSFVVFVVTVKLLRLIRFSKSVYQLHHTINQSIKKLGSLFLLFLVIMIALSFMATIAFGNLSHSFSSFVNSLSKLMHLLAGGKIFQKDSSFSESPLGLIFVIFYTFLTTFLLVNILLSVIIDSFAASKSNTEPKVIENAQLSDFMKNHIHTALSNNKIKLDNFIGKRLNTRNYKTEKKNGEKYIYQGVKSIECDFDDVELEEKRHKGQTSKEKKLCKHHQCNDNSLEKLQFDSIFQEETEATIHDDACLHEIINILRSITSEDKM